VDKSKSINEKGSQDRNREEDGNLETIMEETAF
jgi:hypothetical protein